jgi:hypothetical protein
MPCISGNYSPAAGPLIQVAIISDIMALGDVPPGEVSPEMHLFTALIDTGASGTCISNKVVADCGLVPTGRTLMTGATGESVVDQFTFGVGFLLSPHQTPTGFVQTELNVRAVQGCQFHNGGVGFDVLLGRDIICGGSFSLSFDGHFILSF